RAVSGIGRPRPMRQPRGSRVSLNFDRIEIWGEARSPVPKRSSRARLLWEVDTSTGWTDRRLWRTGSMHTSVQQPEPDAPSATQYPFLQLEGTPFDVGRAHGEGLGDRIQVGLDHYRSMFEERAGVEWSRATEFAGRLADPIRAYAP